MSRMYRMEPRIFGVASAVVIQNSDPDRRGRVRVRYPWLGEESESGWARVAVPYAGKERGCYIIPEVGDEVVIAFEEGDPDRPVVIGSVWSGSKELPCEPPDTNSLKWVESRSGFKVICEDAKGAERLILRDGSDRRWIEIDAARGKIRIVADEGDIEISAPKGRVSIECKEFELTCSRNARANVEGDLSISSRGSATVEAKRSLSCKSQGQILQSGRSLEARGATALILRGNRVEIQADTLLRQKAPLVKIN